MWAPSNILEKSPISAKHRAETEHRSIADNHPQSHSKREKERRTTGLVVIMWHSASHTTPIVRRRSFIKLKCIRNVCPSWGTLAEQVTPNPRFSCIYFFIFIYLSVHLFLRESTSKGGAERGGQRIWSRLCADSSEPDVGLELTNCEVTTWAESDASPTEPPRRPKVDLF